MLSPNTTPPSSPPLYRSFLPSKTSCIAHVDRSYGRRFKEGGCTSNPSSQPTKPSSPLATFSQICNGSDSNTNTTILHLTLQEFLEFDRRVKATPELFNSPCRYEYDDEASELTIYMPSDTHETFISRFQARFIRDVNSFTSPFHLEIENRGAGKIPLLSPSKNRPFERHADAKFHLVGDNVGQQDYSYPNVIFETAKSQDPNKLSNRLRSFIEDTCGEIKWAIGVCLPYRERREVVLHCFKAEWDLHGILAAVPVYDAVVVVDSNGKLQPGCLRIAIADIVANSETTCPPELASASLSIPFESIASFAHHAIKTSPAPDAVVNTIDRIREKHRLQQARKRKAVEDIAPDGRVHVAEGPRFVKGNGKRIKTENPTENPTVSNVEVGGFKDDEVLEEDALEKASVSSNSNRTLIGEDAAPMLASGTADTSASTLQNPANSYRPPQHPRSGARKRTRSSPRQNQRPFSQRSESATTTTSDSRLSRNGSPASQPQRQVSTRMRKKPKSG